MDPKIDPKIEPESPKHRKKPGNYACACKNTRALPGKSTLRSSKMIPKWGSRKLRVFDAFCEPSKARFTRVLPSKMSIGRKPILTWNGKRGLICQTTHVPDCFRHLNCWTHFPHVHKGRLHVSMHVYGHLRSLRIFLYICLSLFALYASLYLLTRDRSCLLLHVLPALLQGTAKYLQELL